MRARLCYARSVLIALCECQHETERGVRGQCRPCANARGVAYYFANRQQAKACQAAYRLASAKKRRADGAAYYLANRDKIKASKAVHRAANRERANVYAAVYRLANVDKINAYAAAYAKANPEAVRIYTANRRAQKRATGKLSKGLSAKLFKLQKGKCACCGKPLGDNYHLDHVMPLSLGGANTDTNIQLLTATCNMQKHAKHPVDFMQQRGKLL